MVNIFATLRFSYAPQGVYIQLRHTTHTIFMWNMWKLFKRVEQSKEIFREKFPTNPHDLLERFSCNTDEGNCMLEKCSLWKSSETIDDMKLDSSSDIDSSRENA